MAKQLLVSILGILILFNGAISCRQPIKKNDYLIFFSDPVNNEYGYKNQFGDTIIPLGKYTLCYTDTLKTFAIVLKPDFGFVAIDRQENILYKVYPFDNGPDYESEGLFRIIINDKIGFADAETGKIVIKPQFGCASPFENGTAKVALECKTQVEGEHSSWVSEHWFYIDKKGKKVENPKMVSE